MKKILLQNVRENETNRDISKNIFEEFNCNNDTYESKTTQDTYLNKKNFSTDQVGNSFKIENVLNATVIPSIKNGISLVYREPKLFKNELNTDIFNKINDKNLVKKLKYSNSQSNELDIHMTTKNAVHYNENIIDSLYEQNAKNDHCFLKSNFDPLLTHCSNGNIVKQVQYPKTVNSKQINNNCSDSRNNIETNFQYQKSVIRCLICGKLFNNSSALAKHKLTHSDERKYTCTICSKAFKRQDHLNGHMMTHCSKKPFECKFFGCGKSYCDARSLRRHLENHHQDILGNSSSNSNVRSKIAETNGDEEIKSGLKADQSSSPASIWSSGCNPLDEPKPVKCHICDRGFKNLPALNGHMRLHGGYVRRDSDDDAHNEKNNKLDQIKHQNLIRDDSLNITSNENSNISTKGVNHLMDEYSSIKHFNNNDQFYINYMKPEYTKIPVDNILVNSNSLIGNQYCTEQIYQKNMEINLDSIQKPSYKNLNIFTMPSLVLNNEEHFNFCSKPNYTIADESKYDKKIVDYNKLNDIRNFDSEHGNTYFITENAAPENYELAVNYYLKNNVPNLMPEKHLITEINSKLKSDYVQNIYSVKDESENKNSNCQPFFDIMNLKESENISEYNLLHRRRALRSGLTTSHLSESLNLEPFSDSCSSINSNDILLLYKDRINLSIIEHHELSSPVCVTKAATKYNKISTPITPRSPQTASEPHTPAQGIKFQFPPRQDQVETETALDVIEADLPEGANVNFLENKNDIDTKEVNALLTQSDQICINKHSNSTEKVNYSNHELLSKSSIQTVTIANEVAKQDLFLAPGPASRIKKKFKPSPLSLDSTNLLFKKHSWFQLKSPRFRDVKKIIGTPPPYTPPPMLSPAKKYFRFNEHYGRVDHLPSRKAHTKINERLHSSIKIPIKPHINIGPSYQCILPEYKNVNDDILYQDSSLLDLPSDKLLWSPNDAHQLPEKLMHELMQYPGEESTGGCDEDKERILLLLHIHKGNLKKAVDAFAKDGTNYDLNQEMNKWSKQESLKFTQAILKKNKQFSSISQMIGSKSLKMCIKYYYFWKKKFKTEYKQVKRQKPTRLNKKYNLRSATNIYGKM